MLCSFTSVGMEVRQKGAVLLFPNFLYPDHLSFESDGKEEDQTLPFESGTGRIGEGGEVIIDSTGAGVLKDNIMKIICKVASWTSENLLFLNLGLRPSIMLPPRASLCPPMSS